MASALEWGSRGREFKSLSPDIKSLRVYVYILKSNKDRSLYVGIAKNLEERISCHNKGCNLSTKSRVPWVLVKAEEFNSVSLAMKRERFLKSGRGRELLRKQFG